MPVQDEMNPYKPGEPMDPMLAYYGRLMAWDAAKIRLQAVQASRPCDWSGGGPQRDGAMTIAEIDVQRCQADVAEIKCHAARLFMWMKAMAEFWFAEELFTDPQPESFAIWQRAVMKWKADAVQNNRHTAGEVMMPEPDVRPLWQRVRDGDAVVG